ncbi:altered inheritance of mitochondria protein 21 [Calycina marina]|uniref:Altered inheritance of mitochondria protein 21 n=1 Tax=Calycina marina TaxID=1763456 RepID=A0A9P8CKL8_9HELO|nr:altered inheritance of mitochondria protein 21 [Calycina marina]
MSTPQIPPRPSRATESSGNSSTLGSDLPKISPRPARRIERSVSPNRESFARSPLNDMPAQFANQGQQKTSSFYTNESANTSSTELPPRPSSVILPSIGQEGSEYAEVFDNSADLGTSPTTARNIANDLKLHAPKPSLPVSSAKRRVSTVTRTDSGQAAEFGIGKASSDDHEPSNQSLKKRSSVISANNSLHSNDTERPVLAQDSDHGIPEIGQRVPMYPNAGDVQAPSPANISRPFAPGIGFHNDGSKPRHHGRKRSGVDMPFDAYGKHGHGQVPKDRFEQAYYEKHPELFKKETANYHGPFAENRAEFAMSSEDLNKIVRDTASRNAIGTPSEQIGFQASEEYTSRMSSPRPTGTYHVQHSNASFSSQTHVDSPLKESFGPTATEEKEVFASNLTKSLSRQTDTAVDSEVEDEDTIHVDAPSRRISKIDGGSGHLGSAEDLDQTAYDGALDEHGYSAPILASDEVAKEPFGWELQPAVSPMHERHSGHDDYHFRTGSASSQNSRPSSRPGSIHGVPAFHMSTSTPLEDLEEYEPLFPEEEKAVREAAGKPLTAADKLKKRPEFKNRKFPSQDVWEDTPNSLQYTAEVSTPQLPDDHVEDAQASQAHDNETPAEAFARRQEELAEKESHESFLHAEKAPKPWASNPSLLAETRPNLKQRFPSRDIWEDAPDSHLLETTVNNPQSEEKNTLVTPTERPTTGAVVYHQGEAAAGFPPASDEGRATTGIAVTLKPSIPARPTKEKPTDQSPVESAQPSIPERPKSKLSEGASPTIPFKTKPAIPARPSKPITRGSAEDTSLEKVASNSSAKSIGSDSGSAPSAKSKPAVPSRPVGSKIAALQGGFMSELNKKLQIGPKKEEPTPEPEPEQEKAPLVDARKGRARGPARRAPAKSPAPAVEQPSSTFGFSTPSMVWHLDPEEDLLHVAFDEKSISKVEPEMTKQVISPPSVIPSHKSPEVSDAASEPTVSEPLASKEPVEESTMVPESVQKQTGNEEKKQEQTEPESETTKPLIKEATKPVELATESTKENEEMNVPGRFVSQDDNV